MEATIQSSQMDVDKEEARPNPEVSNLPQERHIWRMPELPPIPQGLKHFQVAAIEIYQFQYKNWFRAAKEEEWEIFPSLWQGAMNSYLHIKSFLGQEKTIDLLGEEVTGNDSSFGDRRPSGVYQLQNCPKTSPKDLRRNRGVPRTNKARANWHRPYPQGYRIPKLEPSAMDSVFNMARTLMEFTAKDQERMKRTFPRK
ncbi:hypothetical protein O181_101565 [Austropuccinia psidii MF-1]|uniref:Uncharacterized protein n=1 Tax=Austropuccinia psidii MF-1 TaxID=1389203 RepID=A0A9Q3JHT9_9BASI|nr:hypothetical protein [Austropuccinia psidii MF-1]